MGKYKDKFGHFEVITLSTSRNCPQFQYSEKLKSIFRITCFYISEPDRIQYSPKVALIVEEI